ncbi:MAG: polyprenyl diphosphate synthase [Deltaproteobacteria bacterium]|nr:polyprenyl diphosphate synthase [Deltaproteobacteria bacterium]
MTLPLHVGIIMDGNGRWATARGLPRFEGHKAGLQTLKKIVESCIRLSIKHLSLYTFSTENFSRPPQEVNFLMGLLKEAFHDYLDEAIQKGIKVRIVGNLGLLNDEIRDICLIAENKTCENDVITVYFALAYGGRREILDAVNKILTNARPNQSINEDDFRKHLYCPDMPDVDLLIRTGNEQRISNFLLWQTAYSELLFYEKFWPDFEESDLIHALNVYKSRNRRFGRTPEQSSLAQTTF